MQHQGRAHRGGVRGSVHQRRPDLVRRMIAPDAGRRRNRDADHRERRKDRRARRRKRDVERHRHQPHHGGDRGPVRQRPGEGDCQHPAVPDDGEPFDEAARDPRQRPDGARRQERAQPIHAARHPVGAAGGEERRPHADRGGDRGDGGSRPHRGEQSGSGGASRRSVEDRDSEQGQHGDDVEQALEDDRRQHRGGAQLLPAREDVRAEQLADAPGQDRRCGEPHHRGAKRHPEADRAQRPQQPAPADRPHDVGGARHHEGRAEQIPARAPHRRGHALEVGAAQEVGHETDREREDGGGAQVMAHTATERTTPGGLPSPPRSG